MLNIDKDMPVNLWSHLIEREIDPLTQLVTIGFEMNIKVGDDAEPDLGKTSPYLLPVDNYYDRICNTLFAGQLRWQGEWIHMVAEIDAQGVLCPFVAGQKIQFFVNTKWFVPARVLEQFFDLIENLDIADESGLQIMYVEGVSRHARQGGDDFTSRLKTALSPLNLDYCKTYPQNFTRQSDRGNSVPGAAENMVILRPGKARTQRKSRGAVLLMSPMVDHA